MPSVAARRVLIVEDEYIVAADIESQLRDLGFEPVGIAASGKEALALVDQLQPDIVLMDIQLQGSMTGIQAAEHIYKSTGAAIIFLTAFASVFLRDPQQMQPPGICLCKPFSKHQLKSALLSITSEPNKQ